MKVEFNVKENMSDEDDDLESLRLAALQTIKKPTNNIIQPSPVNVYKNNSTFNASPQGKRVRSFQGGRQRNGQFNHRVRNTNLISIPTVPCEEKDEKIKTPFKSTESVPKLILPQDRYCNNKVASETKSSEVTSKFTRYDNSDDSESDSEDEEEVGSESPKKLERSDSLEALMQELENEIQGESKPKVQEKKVKVKRLKKIAKGDVTESEIVNEQTQIENVENDVLNADVELAESERVIEQKENLNETINKNTAPLKQVVEKASVKHFSKQIRSKHSSAKWKNNKPAVYPIQQNVYQPPYIHPAAPYQNFVDPQMQYNVPYQPTVPVTTPLFPEVPIRQPRYDLPRPLSPLSLNAEVLSTVTMAPLSPRSAAFVLQNREIIERRKRSPRRSYSRSPTPFSSKSSSISSRGSRSPLNPRNSLPKRNLSPPSKDSSTTRSNRRVIPKNRVYNSSSKPEVEKSDEKKSKRIRRSNSLSLSPSPVRTETKKTDEKIEDAQKNLPDPVLEARRKKFESKEISKTEGVIRLKPKIEEKSPKEADQTEDNEINEDELLKDDESVIDLKVDDLFSDEDESEDENEGRFKVKSSEKRKVVPILPFTQLVSGGAKSKNIEAETVPKERSPRENRERKRDHAVRKRHRSRSPVESNKKKSERKVSNSDKKRDSSDKAKNPNRHKIPVSAPIECKKIEIKIRNPSKYNDETKEQRRKVDVKKPKEEEPEPEIIIENDEEEVENNSVNKSEGGDLRAQLSRKRAERQSKFPVMDGVPSRIIQNAFQGAVFKKVRKVKKEIEAAPKDGKIPIHLRLGNSDIGADVKIRKKVSRKRKNQLEQV